MRSFSITLAYTADSIALSSPQTQSGRSFFLVPSTGQGKRHSSKQCSWRCMAARPHRVDGPHTTIILHVQLTGMCHQERALGWNSPLDIGPMEVYSRFV